MLKSAKIIALTLLSGLIVYLFKPAVFLETEQPRPKELLIYCGITMVQPISEIAAIIEAQENIKISIIKGGSGNLLKSIRFNQIGDLYLPGSTSYIETARQEGLISESVMVGFNKAAMMVQKGNPKFIPEDLNALKNKELFIAIGNPDSGSIGKETQKILESAGIFTEVVSNISEMTTDSKRLVEILVNGEADLIINWYAVSTWKRNKDFIEVLSIDERYAKKKSLTLGLLNSSKYPQIAKRFMAYAQSKKGNEIFDRYGLYHVE